jgi:selenide,water dikinase
MIDEAALDTVVRLMTTLNKSARDCAVNYRVHACTDVTGFFAHGHMLEMMQGSEASARVETGAVDFLPVVLDFAIWGFCPRRFTATALLQSIPWTKNPSAQGAGRAVRSQDVRGTAHAVDPLDADALERICVRAFPAPSASGP